MVTSETEVKEFHLKNETETKIIKSMRERIKGNQEEVKRLLTEIEGCEIVLKKLGVESK